MTYIITDYDKVISDAPMEIDVMLACGSEAGPTSKEFVLTSDEKTTLSTILSVLFRNMMLFALLLL